MIIITNPLNPYLCGIEHEKIYQPPQKVVDEYNHFKASMKKMKNLPIIYISTLGVTLEDLNVESDN